MKRQIGSARMPRRDVLQRHQRRWLLVAGDLGDVLATDCSVFLSATPASGAAPLQNAVPERTPNFRNNIADGQKPVKDACSKLAPTKAVNHNQ